jgi:TusA-related sulfurtransferase
MNWVRTKLALEELPEGDTLDVILDDGEPMRNVPRSAKGEGHRILQVQEQKDGAYRLTIRSGST